MHPHIRAAFDHVLILNGGFDEATGREAVASGEADAIAYGVPFIANPDLPRRFRAGATLNVPDQEAFYHARLAGGTRTIRSWTGGRRTRSATRSTGSRRRI